MPDYVFAFPGLGVPDIDAARTFYRDVLGLTVNDEDMGQLSIDLPGGGWVLLYPKPDHTPAAERRLRSQESALLLEGINTLGGPKGVARYHESRFTIVGGPADDAPPAKDQR